MFLSATFFQCGAFLHATWLPHVPWTAWCWTPGGVEPHLICVFLVGLGLEKTRTLGQIMFTTIIIVIIITTVISIVTTTTTIIIIKIHDVCCVFSVRQFAFVRFDRAKTLRLGAAWHHTSDHQEVPATSWSPQRSKARSPTWTRAIRAIFPGATRKKRATCEKTRAPLMADGIDPDGGVEGLPFLSLTRL